jgi:hypothetical protein
MPITLAYAYDDSFDDQFGLMMISQALRDDGIVTAYSRAFDENGLEILKDGEKRDQYCHTTLEAFREKYKRDGVSEETVSELRIVHEQGEWVNRDKYQEWKFKAVYKQPEYITSALVILNNFSGAYDSKLPPAELVV